MLANDNQTGADCINQLNDLAGRMPSSQDNVCVNAMTFGKTCLLFLQSASLQCLRVCVIRIARTQKVQITSPGFGKAGGLFKRQIGRWAEIGCDDNRSRRLQRKLSHERLLHVK